MFGGRHHNSTQTEYITQSTSQFLSDRNDSGVPFKQLHQEIISELQELAERFVDALLTPKVPVGEFFETWGVSTHRPPRVCKIGSCRMGVDLPDSDLDLVCFVPKGITLDDFFQSFFRDVEIASEDRYEWDRPVAVRTAKAPLIKCRIRNISVDILFANLLEKEQSMMSLMSLSASELARVNLGNAVSKRSISALLDADKILRKAQSYAKRETFRLFVKIVKLWAKRRGVYGQSMGFPGGMAWAIMCAEVCEKNPRAALNTLLEKMFETHLRTMTEYLSRDQSRTTPLEVLSPLGFNCTSKVMHSSVLALQQEMQRALSQIRNASSKQDWEHLFKPFCSEFFKGSHFFQISTPTIGEAVVESRLSTMFKILDSHNFNYRTLPQWFHEGNDSSLYIRLSHSDDARVIHGFDFEVFHKHLRAVKIHECRNTVLRTHEIPQSVMTEANCQKMEFDRHPEENRSSTQRGSSASSFSETRYAHQRSTPDREGMDWKTGLALFGGVALALGAGAVSVQFCREEERRRQEEERRRRNNATLIKLLIAFVVVIPLSFFAILRLYDMLFSTLSSAFNSFYDNWHEEFWNNSGWV